MIRTNDLYNAVSQNLLSLFKLLPEHIFENT